MPTDTLPPLQLGEERTYLKVHSDLPCEHGIHTLLRYLTELKYLI